MSTIKRPKKVTLEGYGDLTLRTADYVTEGGEGAIYRKGGYIIKLYHDAQKMQRDDMSEKIHLLASSLKHPSIVTPKGLVIDSNEAIGYYMPFVQGEAYPKLFTNDFRNQNGIDTLGVTHLATKMHEVVDYVHRQGALLVDANELNWLADIKDVRQPTPTSSTSTRGKSITSKLPSSCHPFEIGTEVSARLRIGSLGVLSLFSYTQVSTHTKAISTATNRVNWNDV